MESEEPRHWNSSLQSPLIQQEEDDDPTRSPDSDGGKAVAETGRSLSLCSSVGTGEEVFEEIKKQLRLAGPLVAVNFLLYCLQMISVMFVGHLGQLPLAGASIATSFATVTGFSLLVNLKSCPKIVHPSISEVLSCLAFRNAVINNKPCRTHRSLFVNLLIEGSSSSVNGKLAAI